MRPLNRPGEPLGVRLCAADVPLAVEDGNRAGDSESHWVRGTNPELRIRLDDDIKSERVNHHGNLNNDIFLCTTMPILYVYRGQRKIGPRRENYDVRPVLYSCPPRF